MTPYRGDFVTYQEIKPKLLSAANKEFFMAYSIGDIIISIPNNEEHNNIRLTNVLYMLSTAFSLISIGRIDDTGYYTTFGGGACEVHDAKGNMVGHFQESDGVYRVQHRAVNTANVATSRNKHMTLRELHERMGHIAARAVHDLVKKGTIQGVDLTDNNVDFQCIPCIKAKMK
jgi:hypothetical protein